MSLNLAGYRLKKFGQLHKKILKVTIFIENASEKIPKNKYRDFVIHCAEYKLS